MENQWSVGPIFKEPHRVKLLYTSFRLRQPRTQLPPIDQVQNSGDVPVVQQLEVSGFLQITQVPGYGGYGHGMSCAA